LQPSPALLGTVFYCTANRKQQAEEFFNFVRTMSEEIINKVAESGLITIDLEKYLPAKNEMMVFDLKDFLFMGMILKEKDFREALKQQEWEQYRNKNVVITCSADAIIPVWAYMLAMTYLQPLARYVITGSEKELNKAVFLKNISAINTTELADKRIVLKGCGETHIDEFAYAEATRILLPVVKSIMYGEPCSTVPVYKKK
jgi:hypothetical protein